jgi:hypothetical protein
VMTTSSGFLVVLSCVSKLCGRGPGGFVHGGQAAGGGRDLSNDGLETFGHLCGVM